MTATGDGSSIDSGSQVRRSGSELISGRRYPSIGSGELSRQLGYCRPECLAGILRRLELLRARGGEVDRDLDAIRDRLRLPGDARPAGPQGDRADPQDATASR